jgi:lipopolysaccharide export system permease protein
MRTVRRLLYRDIVWSVVFVAIAFLSLFYFIDFVDELDNIGRDGFTLVHAAISAALEQPGHLYELSPICVLIGTIYSMARLAQSSEYTILRTGGLGPVRALRLLALLGLFFGGVTFVVGDYLSPLSEREAVLLKASFRGGLALGRAGVWLKERRHNGDDQERAISINVARTAANGELDGIRTSNSTTTSLRTRIEVRRAVSSRLRWRLKRERTEWLRPIRPAGARSRSAHGSMNGRVRWRPAVAGSAAGEHHVDGELWRYSAHLDDQEQVSQRYEILFWKKALYPFACLVMVAAAAVRVPACAPVVSLKVLAASCWASLRVAEQRSATWHAAQLARWLRRPGLIYLALSAAYLAGRFR